MIERRLFFIAASTTALWLLCGGGLTWNFGGHNRINGECDTVRSHNGVEVNNLR